MGGARAIVVGVEQYAAGWRLDGPASDACRFVEILLTHGIAADSIILLANPLPDNEQRVKDLGLPVLPPDRAMFTRLLREQLPTDSPEQLYFFWGGHGVVDGEGNRRLFYADATVADKRNLDFTDLLASLMTSAYPGLRHQFLAVDACQNLADQLRYAAMLPRDQFPRGSAVAGREQHVLLSASPGQASRNDTANKTGVFSRELLKILAEPRTPWPPDADALASRLDAIFDRLRTEDHSTQTPTYFWRKSPRRDGLVYELRSAPAPSRPTSDQVGTIIDTMLESSELSSVPNLHQIILLMPPLIRGAVRYTGIARTDILAWIMACQEYSTGRAALVGALRLGMANRDALDRVLSAVDKNWPPPPTSAGGAS